MEEVSHFEVLANAWHEATDHLSVPSKRFEHPAYCAILDLKMAAVPYILQDLQARGGDWYLALQKITGVSPIPPEAQGDVELMNYHWFEWAKEQGYAL